MNDQTDLTVIIPTHDRPDLLKRAVSSILDQQVRPDALVVVDDGSRQPVSLPSDPRLTILTQSQSGAPTARNRGAHTARTRYVTFLDDDDEHTPTAVALLAEALHLATIEFAKDGPIGVLAAMEVVDADGRVRSVRVPPTCPRGVHFGLEPIPTGTSWLTKQTLAVDREAFLAAGGFDESMPSRQSTELLLRLTQRCSLLGIRQPTYRFHAHQGQRISDDPRRRAASFDLLWSKHRATFADHPRAAASLAHKHAKRLRKDGALVAALRAELLGIRCLVRRPTLIAGGCPLPTEPMQ